MSIRLTIITPVVKIRRGPSIAAGIIRDAKIGEQFDVVQVIDPQPKSLEQWAKIVLPDQQDTNAYICVRLPSGNALCEISNAPTPGKSPEYQNGFRDGVEHVLRWVSAERAKLG